MSDRLYHLALVRFKTMTQTVKSAYVPHNSTRVLSSEGTAPPTKSSVQGTVSHPPPLLVPMRTAQDRQPLPTAVSTPFWRQTVKCFCLRQSIFTMQPFMCSGYLERDESALNQKVSKGLEVNVSILACSCHLAHCDHAFRAPFTPVPQVAHIMCPTRHQETTKPPHRVICIRNI